MCMSIHWTKTLLFVALFMVHCNQPEFDTRYYLQTHAHELISHIEEVAGHAVLADSGTSNFVFLLVLETSCSSCLSEIRWWEQNQHKFEDTNLYILVTSKYESVGSAFLEQQEITIPSIFDTTNNLRDEDLVPTLPVKLLINNKGEIQKIYAINNGEKLDVFIEELTK